MKTLTAAKRAMNLIAVGLFVSLMIYGHLTGAPNTVEWPTGATTTQGK